MLNYVELHSTYVELCFQVYSSWPFLVWNELMILGVWWDKSMGAF